MSVNVKSLRNRFLCAALVLLASLSFAQTDIVNNQTGPYITLGRGLLWGVSGGGGMNNGFVITPYLPDTGVCIQISNSNSGIAETYSLLVVATLDPSATGEIANPQGWGIIWGLPALASIQPGGTQYYFVKIAAAAKAEVILSGSGLGTSNTGTILLSLASSGCATQGPSGGGGQGVSSMQGSYIGGASLAGTSHAPTFCDQNVTVTVASGTSAFLTGSTAGPNPQIPIPHVCSYAVTGPLTLNSANITFYATVTNGSCPGITTAIWTLTTGIGITNFALSSNGGQLFQGSGASGISQESLCVANTGTGTTVTVSIAYATY